MKRTTDGTGASTSQPAHPPVAEHLCDGLSDHPGEGLGRKGVWCWPVKLEVEGLFVQLGLLCACVRRVEDIDQQISMFQTNHLGIFLLLIIILLVQLVLSTVGE